MSRDSTLTGTGTLRFGEHETAVSYRLTTGTLRDGQKIASGTLRDFDAALLNQAWQSNELSTLELEDGRTVQVFLTEHDFEVASFKVSGAIPGL